MCLTWQNVLVATLVVKFGSQLKAFDMHIIPIYFDDKESILYRNRNSILQAIHLVVTEVHRELSLRTKK